MDARKKETTRDKTFVFVFVNVCKWNHMLCFIRSNMSLRKVNYHCSKNKIILYGSVESEGKTLVLNSFESKDRYKGQLRSAKCIKNCGLKEESIMYWYANKVYCLTQSNCTVKSKRAVIENIVHGCVRRYHKRCLIVVHAALPCRCQNGVSFEIVETRTKLTRVQESDEQESIIIWRIEITYGMDFKRVQCCTNYTVANAPSSSISMRKALKCKHKLSMEGAK